MKQRSTWIMISAEWYYVYHLMESRQQRNFLQAYVWNQNLKSKVQEHNSQLAMLVWLTVAYHLLSSYDKNTIHCSSRCKVINKGT